MEVLIPYEKKTFACTDYGYNFRPDVKYMDRCTGGCVISKLGNCPANFDETYNNGICPQPTSNRKNF